MCWRILSAFIAGQAHAILRPMEHRNVTYCCTIAVPLIAIVAAAQTASDLTARYGYPDVERFVVRPGITMMASNNEDRTASEMVIEPKHSSQQPNDKEQSVISLKEELRYDT